MPLIKEISIYILLFGLLALFTLPYLSDTPLVGQVFVELKTMNTVFVSIVLEALPFLLLGALFASVIEIFISPTQLQRLIPNNPILAIPTTILVAFITPICECAIIPVVHKLISKGMKPYIGIVLLLSAPILNPIVFLSTYHAFAFPQGGDMLLWRMIMGIIVPSLIGFFFFFHSKSEDIQKTNSPANHEHTHHHASKLKSIAIHTAEEFFSIGKFFVIGALLAGVFQTVIDRNILSAHFTNEMPISIATMMGLSFLLSLCSEADAFVASSFSGTFPFAALLGFLVYGPMLDIRNLFVYSTYFKLGFIIKLFVTVTVIVFICVMSAALLGLEG